MNHGYLKLGRSFTLANRCRDFKGLGCGHGGELDIRVGNRAKVAVMAVGTYHLSLPSG
jgi:hypothetical protein